MEYRFGQTGEKKTVEVMFSGKDHTEKQTEQIHLLFIGDF